MNPQDGRRLRWLFIFNGTVGLVAVSPLLIIVLGWNTLTTSGRTGPAPSVLFFGLTTLTIPAGVALSLIGSLWQRTPKVRQRPPLKWD